MAYKQLPILYVVQVGESDFQRFFIEDQKNRVWTGERFDMQGAALFARHNDAAVEAQNILKKNFDGMKPQRYVVPLCVEVYGHAGPVPLADVAEYLSNASRLYLNTTDHGNGPGDSLVLPIIEWHRMRPIKESPHE